MLILLVCLIDAKQESGHGVPRHVPSALASEVEAMG